jgi:hypothetical protein
MAPPLQLTRQDFESQFFGNIVFSDFKNRFFRQAHLLVKGISDEYYSNIFSKGDFSRLLSETMLHRPSVRMAGEGRVLPMSEISTSIPYGMFSFENVVDLEKVEHWYRRGYTINLRGAHYNHAGLAASTKILKEMFGCNIRANLYLAPSGQRGLVPHYDVHDVVVIQISGAKTWSLFENNFENPTENFRFGRRPFDVGSVVSEVELAPGDLLYLPRGWSHAATSVHDSLHLTIGIEEPTAADLLRAVADLLETEADLRESIEFDRLVEDVQYRTEVSQILAKCFGERIEGGRLIDAVELCRRKNFDRALERNVSFLNGL